jgi:triphosphoribosyl-dephospho-CoA synthase
VTPAQTAQLALLLEVAATPTPGAVDRCRDHPDLRFEHLLAGAVGAADGLAAAAAGEPLGASFEQAVGGMAGAQTAGNTQFGALLALVPLVRAAAVDELSPAGVTAVVEATTVDDAVAFCRAFAHVDVAVAEPPAGLTDLDVRQPAAAARAVERRGWTLADLMARSAPTDGIAREWSTGFERTFETAEVIGAAEGPVTDRAARAFLERLGETPDTHIATRHDATTAEQASERARAAVEGETDPDELAESLVADRINPGTAADVLAAGLFVALERGLSV